MKCIYIGFIVLATIWGLAESCSNYKTEKIILELYASPKSYSCSMLFNNGIFNFRLNKKSL